jgi:hypothetical protein
MVGLVIAFPQLVGRDTQLTSAQMDAQGQTIDIEKMLQEDAAADTAREAKKAEGATPKSSDSANEGDAITKAIRDAGKQ